MSANNAIEEATLKFFKDFAEKFSGEDFTVNDLTLAYYGDKAIADKKKTKKTKKKKKSSKTRKMSVRNFIMQDPEWKAKINKKKDEITAENVGAYEEEVEDADGDSDIIAKIAKAKKGNFMSATSLILEDIDDDEMEEIQEKVDEINEKIASDSEKNKDSDSSDDG